MKFKYTLIFVFAILLFSGCSDSLQDQHFQHDFQMVTAFINSVLLYSPLVLLMFSIFMLGKYRLALFVFNKEKRKTFRMYWERNIILYPALPYIIFVVSWALAFFSVQGMENYLEKLVVLKETFLLAFTTAGYIKYRIFLVLFTVAYSYLLYYICYFNGVTYKEWVKEYKKEEAKRKQEEKRKKKARQKAAKTIEYDRDDNNWWERMDDPHESPFGFKRR